MPSGKRTPSGSTANVRTWSLITDWAAAGVGATVAVMPSAMSSPAQVILMVSSDS